MIGFLLGLLSKTVSAVVTSLAHNWLPLSLAILIAAVLRAQVDTEKLKLMFLKRTKASIFTSVVLGAFTPFCACGTMAVVIGMLTTTLPWGPVMAFLTSSPLMSPDGFILLAGIISVKFAVAMTAASIAIGLGSGYLTHLIESRSSLLHNQTRLAENPDPGGCSCAASLREEAASACACMAGPDIAPVSQCGCPGPVPVPVPAKEGKVLPGTIRRFLAGIRWRETLKGLVDLGLKRILPNFAIFVAIGFLVNYFVPVSFIMSLFSSRNIFAVPLATVIGLPLYVTIESALPLINTLMAGGASGGAMMGFMIAGSATSAWVIAGISMFMKKRIIGLYILFIVLGGILAGYAYDLLSAVWR